VYVGVCGGGGCGDDGGGGGLCILVGGGKLWMPTARSFSSFSILSQRDVLGRY
jgi:hypothetical protein